MSTETVIIVQSLTIILWSLASIVSTLKIRQYRQQLSKLKQLAHVANFGQEAPKPGDGDLWQELIDGFDAKFSDLPPEKAVQIKNLFAARRMMGIEKYKTPLQRNNGRNAIRDYQEEILDAIVYGSSVVSDKELTVLVGLLAATDLKQIETLKLY